MSGEIPVRGDGSAAPRLSAFMAFNNPQFRRFYTGALVAQLGFWLSHISYQGLMADLTTDEIWVPLLFVATLMPIMILGPFGGVIVDRYDRRRVLIACYGGMAATTAFQLVLFLTDVVTPLWLLFSGVLIGVGMAVLGPAVHAVTANVVEGRELQSAVSMQAIASNLTRVVGPAIAAPLVRQGLFAVTWSVYLLAAAFAMFVMTGVSLRSFERDADRGSVRSRLMSGLQHARDRPPAAACLVFVSVVSALAVSHTALVPAFTEDALGRPKGDFAWLVAAVGAGAMFGAAIAGSLSRAPTMRRGTLLALPYCLLLVVFSRTDELWVALAVQFVMGFFYISSFTTMQVVVQQVVDERLRGRVMSLFQLAWAGVVPLGSLLMGLMAGSAGLDLGAADTLFWTGLAASIWVVLTLVWLSSPSGTKASTRLT